MLYKILIYLFFSSSFIDGNSQAIIAYYSGNANV